jgi:acyl-coenzyme A synthetase/AMP-(fatty) acid ligase
MPPNVRLAISAGAPLPLPLEQTVFEKTGIKLHNFYGASECGGIAYDATLVPRSDAACIGAPMSNVNLSVNDEGCLEVRSRAVGETYWPEPDENLAGSCYRTSDLAELKDGLVFLRGRASDLINVAGRKISPESVERVLLTHPDVSDCLVFGVTNERHGRGETVVAVVVSRRALTNDELRQFLLKQMPAWQVPREWFFVDSLEANQRGKRSRAEWRRRFQNRPRT